MVIAFSPVFGRRGFAAFPLLVVLILSSLALATIHSSSLLLLRLSSMEKSYEQARSGALESAFTAAASGSSQFAMEGSTAEVCKAFESTGSLVKISRTICLRRSNIEKFPVTLPVIAGSLLESRSSFPLFELESQLGHLAPCPEDAELGTFDQYLPGIVAPKNCRANGTLAADSLRINGNLLLDGPARIRSSGAAPVLASGVIRSDGVLHTEGSLIIIAGGGVYINELNAADSEFVTIISLSNNIRINLISGNPGFQAIARRDVTIAGEFRDPVAAQIEALTELLRSATIVSLRR